MSNPFIRVVMPPAVRELQFPILHALYRAQDSAAEEFADAYRLQIIVVDALASHEFHDSVTVRTNYQESSDIWQRTREAYSDVKQAKIMEDGLPAEKVVPSPAMVDAILAWMPLKGMEPVRSHAYAITMSIARRGIKARRPAGRAFDVSRVTAFAFFEYEMERVIAEFNQ